MMGFVPRDFHDVPLKETKAGTIASIVLSLASMGALSVCLGKESSSDLASSWEIDQKAARRVQNVRDWSRLPLVCWCESVYKVPLTLAHSIQWFSSSTLTRFALWQGLQCFLMGLESTLPIKSASKLCSCV
jgi:hypothetical protein